MVQLDGRNYNIQTPRDIATDMVNYINSYCAANNIRNRKNEIVFIDMNWANPLFIILFGVGYIVSIVQKIMYSIACGFSITNASDRQLLNLAQIGNVQRRPAKKTTIRCTIQNNRSSDLVIDNTVMAILQIDGKEIIFHPAWPVTIPAGDSDVVLLISDLGGAYPVEADTLIPLYINDEPLTGIILVHDDAVVGSDEETLISMRERLQNRTVMTSRIDAMLEALENLPGVNKAMFFFNYSPSVPEVVHNITVPPRMGLLIVQGSNENIASTFYSYMSCETVDCSAIYPERAVTSTFTTRAGQDISVYYILPVQERVYIKVYTKAELNTNMTNEIKLTCAMAGQNLNINDPLTSSDVIKLIQERHPELAFDGVMLSKDGTNYALSVKPTHKDGLFITKTSDVSVEVTV